MVLWLDVLHAVTDDALMRLSTRNPGYQFERTADGRLVVAPTGSKSSWRSGELFGQLRDWNKRLQLGRVFDASAGFRLPDGSCLSPDASWIRRARWEALPRQAQEGFAPICPDAVFEVRSPWDALAEMRAKMRAYLANGAQLAVLVDPEGRAVEVYRPGQQPERFAGVDHVSFEPELPAFRLALGPLFDDG